MVVGCPETLALRLCQQSQITQNKRTYQTDYQGYRGDPKCIDSLSDSEIYIIDQGWGQVQYLYFVLVLKYIFISTWCT